MQKDEERIDRRCVVCGQDCWKIINPKRKVTAIQCLNCQHVELEILANKKEEMHGKTRIS
jgi:hypothetical protein